MKPLWFNVEDVLYVNVLMDDLRNIQYIYIECEGTEEEFCFPHTSLIRSVLQCHPQIAHVELSKGRAALFKPHQMNISIMIK